MLKYNIIVEIDDKSKIVLPVEYENEYALKRDIINIGVNGVTQKIGKNYLYFPPHKIVKITINEIL